MEHEILLSKETGLVTFCNQSPTTYRIPPLHYQLSLLLRLRSRLILAPRSPRIHVSQSSLHLAVANNAKCEAPCSSRVEDNISRVPWSIFLRRLSGHQSVSELVELIFPVLLEIHGCERNAWW